MKTIIAGSRNCNNIKELIKAIEDCNWVITTVISGKAKGADTLGELWAKYMKVPIIEFPADWKTYGRSAGPRRNIQMADNAEALIALWDGESRGTKHMISVAEEKQLLVHVHKFCCDG